MPQIATKLTSAAKGGFIARKVIPFDVRDEYAKLYEQHTEERLKIEPMRIELARFTGPRRRSAFTRTNNSANAKGLVR